MPFCEEYIWIFPLLLKLLVETTLIPTVLRLRSNAQKINNKFKHLALAYKNCRFLLLTVEYFSLTKHSFNSPIQPYHTNEQGAWYLHKHAVARFITQPK